MSTRVKHWKMLHVKTVKQISCLLGLALTGACSTPRAGPLEIPGLEQLSAPCPPQPPALSDAEVAELVARLPTPEERERSFWAPRDLDHRANELCESARAEVILRAAREHNRIVRER